MKLPDCIFFQIQKGRQSDLLKRLRISVPRTGIEPALPCDNQILSLARLPIPPSGLIQRAAILLR